LTQWHNVQGYIDSTKESAVRKVIKGIRKRHQAQEKMALLVQLDQLNILVQAVATFILQSIMAITYIYLIVN